jgi:type IV pilus assembly protein PilA
MIVVAIMGVLAAIALPTYRQYVVRSQMAEPLEALAEAKSAVVEYVATNGRYPADKSLFAMTFGTRNSDILHKVTVSPDPPVDGQRIYVVAQIYASVVQGGPKDSLNLLGFQLSGSTNADGSMSWECLPGFGRPRNYAVPIEYLPSTCSG